MTRPKQDLLSVKKPTFRKLRGYAFDPSLSLKPETVMINNITYKVPWEDPEDPNDPNDRNRMHTGPVGEYLEVIDPTVDRYYAPVDLPPHLLAQDGLEPSESHTQFHQQMVYAIAMTTIKNFEAALGRQVLWSPHPVYTKKTLDNRKSITAREDQFVRRLRVYPHAFRDANAYYSPQKKALLFGYFSAQPLNNTLQMPNSLVFTCLSHDIIAHETAHAILDGMFRRYIEATNADVLAFHEAFADIVALFQHFTFPEVLKSQIAKTRGDLASQNLLGELVQEFGTAVGNYGALRDVIGYYDKKEKVWKPLEPNGEEYRTVMEPHKRGSILVSAVFEAFLTIYKSRGADLTRIASGGSGVLPLGELHPDLVNRLAGEAAMTAAHVLKMCIRALDYCPPVDITFGDYLRALITADVDLIAEDNRDYRLAFIDAFRKREIYPSGICNLSVESLTYEKPKTPELDELFRILGEFLRDFRNDIIYERDREKIFDITRTYIAGSYEDENNPVMGLHRRLGAKFSGSVAFEQLTGLVFNRQWRNYGIRTSKAYGASGPSFEVQSLKLASRVGPEGNQSNQIIVTVVQRTGVTVTEQQGDLSISSYVPEEDNTPPGSSFELYGGATLIFDLDTTELKYVISKPILDKEALKAGKHQLDRARVLQVYNYYFGKAHRFSAYEAYFGVGRQHTGNEPFCFLHQH